jgi:hypothetical protein
MADVAQQEHAQHDEQSREHQFAARIAVVDGFWRGDLPALLHETHGGEKDHHAAETNQDQADPLRGAQMHMMCRARDFLVTQVGEKQVEPLSRKPRPTTASAVRTQARYVRSFAAWSEKCGIIALLAVRCGF